MQHKNEEKVHEHVDETGGGQVVERPFRVADGTKDRTSEVIKHHDRHTEEVDAQVKGGLIDNICRGAHQHKHRTGKDHAEKSKHNAAHNADAERGVNRFRGILVPFRADIARDKHICSDRKTEEQVRDEADKRPGRTDGAHGRVIDKLAHDNQVHRVEQKLQHAGQNKGHGEPQHLARQRTGAHVDCMGITDHKSAPCYF